MVDLRPCHIDDKNDDVLHPLTDADHQDSGTAVQRIPVIIIIIRCERLSLMREQKPTKGNLVTYDKVSDQPFIWVREMDESESGQMLLEKVKWTFSDAYLWQTMWNHAKKSMEGSKLSDLVFLQWEVTVWQELFAKNAENKED